MFEEMFRKRELKCIYALDALANAQLTKLDCVRSNRWFDLHEYVKYLDIIESLRDAVESYNEMYPTDSLDADDMFKNVALVYSRMRDVFDAQL